MPTFQSYLDIDGVGGVNRAFVIQDLLILIIFLYFIVDWLGAIDGRQHGP